MVRAFRSQGRHVLPWRRASAKFSNVEYQHGRRKMGGLVHVNQRTEIGALHRRKFKPEERLENCRPGPQVDGIPVQGCEGYFMMDPESYDQVQLESIIWKLRSFLQPT